MFTLIVDDFGVKYVSKNDDGHLIDSIKSTYTLTKDLTGNVYCGITLEWARIRTHTSDPYAQLPYHPKPRKIESEVQANLPPNATPPLDVVGIKRVQKIVGSILYYAGAIDMMVLMGLSSIVVEQTKAMEKSMG